MLQSLLFNGVMIFDVMESQKAQLRQAASRVSESEIRSDEKRVVERLVEQFALDIPVLLEDKKYATKRDVDVTRRYDWWVHGD
jgi:hypothetical protein